MTRSPTMFTAVRNLDAHVSSRHCSEVFRASVGRRTRRLRARRTSAAAPPARPRRRCDARRPAGRRPSRWIDARSPQIVDGSPDAGERTSSPVFVSQWLRAVLLNMMLAAAKAAANHAVADLPTVRELAGATAPNWPRFGVAVFRGATPAPTPCAGPPAAANSRPISGEPPPWRRSTRHAAERAFLATPRDRCCLAPGSSGTSRRRPQLDAHPRRRRTWRRRRFAHRRRLNSASNASTPHTRRRSAPSSSWRDALGRTVVRPPGDAFVGERQASALRACATWPWPRANPPKVRPEQCSALLARRDDSSSRGLRIYAHMVEGSSHSVGRRTRRLLQRRATPPAFKYRAADDARRPAGRARLPRRAPSPPSSCAEQPCRASPRRRRMVNAPSRATAEVQPPMPSHASTSTCAIADMPAARLAASASPSQWVQRRHRICAFPAPSSWRSGTCGAVVLGRAPSVGSRGAQPSSSSVVGSGSKGTARVSVAAAEPIGRPLNSVARRCLLLLPWAVAGGGPSRRSRRASLGCGLFLALASLPLAAPRGRSN